MPPSPDLVARRLNTDAGPLFAVAFRPLFVGASALAALAVPVFVALLLDGSPTIGGLPPVAWHAHEMVFGFLPAVMAGYLLSATPNRSGRLPASGRPLAGLAALWLAGRLVPPALAALAPVAADAVPWPALLADAAFPLATTAVLAREALAAAKTKAPGSSRHGLALFPLLAGLALGHRCAAAADAADLASAFARGGVAVAILLIAAVGGRLVPSLTRNALAAAGRDGGGVPEPYGRFDVAVLVVALPALAAWAVAPAHPVTAAACGLAAVLQAVRLARWRGWRVRRADVLALHLGYLWVVAGTALAALAAAPLPAVPADAALHAFTAGAIGATTMAVMARLAGTRGAGGRTGPRLAGLAVALANLAAPARVALPFAGAAYAPLLHAAAGLWTLAWTIFLVAQLAGLAADRRPRRSS